MLRVTWCDFSQLHCFCMIGSDCWCLSCWSISCQHSAQLWIADWTLLLYLLQLRVAFLPVCAQCASDCNRSFLSVSTGNPLRVDVCITLFSHCMLLICSLLFDFQCYFLNDLEWMYCLNVNNLINHEMDQTIGCSDSTTLILHLFQSMLWCRVLLCVSCAPSSSCVRMTMCLFFNGALTKAIGFGYIGVHGNAIAFCSLPFCLILQLVP